MNFRYDINGLRAIAVIAVVLFHFNPSWVPGGFSGVDVFFVISGFLMTNIIFRGLKNNNFSLFKFFLARANRIVPPLGFLCGSLIIFSYLFVNVLDQVDIHRHVNGSLLFFSNIIYWNESGYFDTSSHEKWLLHTWSLSVEWQFYIVYPIIIIILKRFLSLEKLKELIIIATITGFAFSVVATIKWPNPAYYLLPTRAWEMMMGGIAFLYPWNVSDTKKKIIEIVGLLLIIISYAFVSSDVPWPGYFALIPVLGSYFIIIANQQSSIITNNTIFQLLGKWSYSIYLWHWPIVVFGFYFSKNNWALLGIPISIALGALSYNFIEKSKYTSIEKFHDLFRFKPLIYLISVMIVTYVASINNGINELPEDYKLTKQQFRDKYEGHLGLYGQGKEPVFINANSSDFDIILIGDSYARHFYSFFQDSGMKVASLAVDGCYSTRDFFSHSDNLCKFRYQDQSNFLKKNRNKIVIISRNWGKNGEKKVIERNSGEKVSIDSKMMLEQLNDLISLANTSGSKVYVVGNNQGAETTPFKSIADLLLSGKNVSYLKEKLKNNVMGDTLRNNSSLLNYKFLDIAKALCQEDNCLTVSDGEVIYTDTGHFSKFGSRIVGNKLFRDIKD